MSALLGAEVTFDCRAASSAALLFAEAWSSSASMVSSFDSKPATAPWRKEPHLEAFALGVEELILGGTLS